MVETTLKRAASTESDFSCEYRIVLPDGVLKHVHSSGRPVVNDRGDVHEFIGIAMDITERHLARAALEDALTKVKESESELRTIIEAIPTHVWCALPDGSTAFQNQRWLDYVGLSAEIACGWGWRQTIHPEEVEQYVARWIEITQTKLPGEAEARFVASMACIAGF
jgi:PAS domain-containing protein